jgi:cyclopropane-fatty-acyl-phospholipid synthase
MAAENAKVCHPNMLTTARLSAVLQEHENETLFVFPMNAISKTIRTALHPTLSVFDKLLGDYPEHDFQVRLWDGTTWGWADTPRFTLVLKRPEAIRRLFLSPNEFSLGEAFIGGEFDVEGDIEAAFGLGDYLLSKKDGLGLIKSLSIESFDRLSPHTQGVTDLPAPELNGEVHSKRRDEAAIRYHYDLVPEFFALWLDPYMLYSSAYFADDSDLDHAQERKLDYICRKLRLHAGEPLLDIGCGWGGLLVYAASHFGVDALGITLSVGRPKQRVLAFTTRVSRNTAAWRYAPIAS